MEPCENCATPVTVLDQRAVWSVLGATDVTGLPGPRLYESYSTSSGPGCITIEQVPHTPERCRELRRRDR